MSEFKKMKPEALVEYFEKIVSIERATTAEIIEVLKEIDSRRIYLDLGYSSLFDYLTKKHGYSPASAQRRIDAARTAQELPEVKECIEHGELKLEQVSMFKKAIRQKEKEGGHVTFQEKRILLQELKTLDIQESQKVIAQALDIEVKVLEKVRIQQDDSVRVECTISKVQNAKVERARELLSHKHPHLGWAELIEVLADELIQRKDPRVPRRKYTIKNATQRSETGKTSVPQEAANSQLQQKAETESPCEQQVLRAVTSDSEAAHGQARTHVPRSDRRHVHQKFQSCQYINPATGHKCNSRFQLQTEHSHSIWAGGDHSRENLTVFCSAHNRQKYRRETNTRRV